MGINVLPPLEVMWERLFSVEESPPWSPSFPLNGKARFPFSVGDVIPLSRGTRRPQGQSNFPPLPLFFRIETNVVVSFPPLDAGPLRGGAGQGFYVTSPLWGKGLRPPFHQPIRTIFQKPSACAAFAPPFFFPPFMNRKKVRVSFFSGNSAFRNRAGSNAPSLNAPPSFTSLFLFSPRANPLRSFPLFFSSNRGSRLQGPPLAGFRSSRIRFPSPFPFPFPLIVHAVAQFFPRGFFGRESCCRHRSMISLFPLFSRRGGRTPFPPERRASFFNTDQARSAPMGMGISFLLGTDFPPHYRTQAAGTGMWFSSQKREWAYASSPPPFKSVPL